MTTVPAVHLMIPENSICLDVLVDDLLNGSVGDKLLESAVDLVDHFGVALGECHSVILGGVLGVEDAESFVSLYEFFCGLVVDDDGVDLVLLESDDSVCALAELLDVLFAVAAFVNGCGSVDIAGGCKLTPTFFPVRSSGF